MTGAPPDSKIDSLRVPPQSIDSEQSVLGGLMLSPDRLDDVRLRISEQDFYRRDHRLIFRAMIELRDRKPPRPIDSVTLGEWFEANVLADQIGSAGYLIELASTTPSAANITAYADIVREKALQRALIDLGTELVNNGFSPEGRDVTDLMMQAEANVQALATTSKRQDLTRPADLLALMGVQSAPPQFVVYPYLPRGEVTLLGSHGGAGKTTLAEIIACHLACGRFVFNAPTITGGGRIAFFSLEDDGPKVAYKLQQIADVYDLDLGMIRANLRVFDWSEGDTALATEQSVDGIRRLVPTTLFAHLKAVCAGCDLIIVDNASDAFDGDENNRRQVGTFMRMLKGVARDNNAAVLLLAHIDKAAARFGAQRNSYAGSTAWHNAARSRLALLDKDDAIEFLQEKLNLGKAAEPFRLRWADHGVLVPIGDGGRPDIAREAGDDAAAVLAAFHAAAAAGISVPTARTGPATAQHVLATFDELPGRLRGGKGREAFWKALGKLQATSRVLTREGYDRNRHLRSFLVIAGSDFAPNPPTPPVAEPAKPANAVAQVRGFDGETGTRETRETREAKTARDYRQKQAGEEA